MAKRFRSLTRLIFTFVVFSLFLVVMLCSCENNTTETGELAKNSDDSVNLIESQVSKIYDDTAKKGNDFVLGNGSDDSVIERYSTTMLELLHAQKAVIVADSETKNDIVFSNKIQQSFVSRKLGWPRLLATVSQNDSQTGIRFSIFSQYSVRENYKMHSYVKLFENTELPKFNTAGTGVDDVNIYDNSLKSDIIETVSKYADLLEKGASSQYSAEFLIDKFQSQIKTAHSDAEGQLSQLGGSSTEIFRPNNNNIFAIRSTDGGALVMAEIDSTWDRSGAGRISATASSPAEKALFSGSQSTAAITVKYVNFVAFYIPPKSVDTDIKVVGAERFPVSAVGH